MQNKGIYELIFKRILDIILAIIALIILSPIYIVLALLIRIKLGSPIIFKQIRPGKNEKCFQCINSELCQTIKMRLVICFQMKKG